MKSKPNRVRQLLIFPVLSLCGWSALAAEETYILAEKNDMPPVGMVANKEFTMKLTEAAMTIKAGDQEIEGTMSFSEATKESMEALDSDRLRLVLKEKGTVGTMTVNGQDRAMPEKQHPLLNKPVILAKKDGKWSAAFEDGSEPDEEEKSALEAREKSANHDSDFAMYGDTPRKVGDVWDADPADTGLFEGDDTKGDYKVRFVEVKDVGGVKCAVLEATFDMSGSNKPKAGEPPMKIGMKGKAVALRSIADKVDLDVKITGTMSMETTPGPEMTMKVEGPMHGEQKVELKRP